MLTFVVPVKSKSVASDWVKFSQLFERTLKSICNQTDSNFKVVVVCHEIPDINYTCENIHFIHPDFQPPSKENISPQEYFINKRIDKGNKIKHGVAYASKKFNTDYVMLVDSDDFVSNKVVSFVNSSANKLPGWYVGNGYLSFSWKNVLVVTKKKFNYLCGSSVIVKPNLIKHFFDKDKINLYFDHRLTTLDSNIELQKVPFPAGIYNIGNGENMNMSFQKVKKLNNHGNWISKQSLKRLSSKFKNYRFRLITPRIRKEFNFYQASN
ncbi:glycosyltransferase family A protein [Maribacter sp. 2304DJ31-5]|uniref:glycosyltransferase family A protein n=1 Tax=Maribacter sp. 2304DJ31-5 TaxID=3386273 RepID=UPI0039BC854E